jgi:hypothetical protein
VYFDDLVIGGQLESFDRDPSWRGQGNREQHDDYGLECEHQFGFSETSFAGGEQGELGGIMFGAPDTPGYYADYVGRLTLDDRLVASGKLAGTRYESDGDPYIGWLDSRKRGFPPANVLAVFIDWPTSTGLRLQAYVGSPDPKLFHRPNETTARIPADGSRNTWTIEYLPDADGGPGRMTVWLDGRQDTFAVPEAVRKQGAAFDRFGLFVHENGGRSCSIYLDDLEHTARDP